ncbi:MAG: hypothetical protein KAX40_02170, partial [Herpetosiphon sp.]|nr:hypothetical protein [Herpetosiphon sp.]
EAFELADRIGVMNHGRLLEVGTPSELYQRPQTDFVATFLGSANVMLGTCDERGMYVGDLFFPLKTAAEERRQNVHVMFRPEDVVLAPSDAMLTIPSFGIATIEQRTFAGSFERLRLRIPAQTVVRSIAPPRPFGDPDILLDAQRPIEASYHMPLTTGDQVQIGVQRIHALAQRGLNVLIASESSRSAAVATGTMLIRQAHGRGTVVLYNTGFEQPDLQPLREQLGVGMTSLALRTSSDELAETLQREIEHLPYDLLVLDAGSQINERARIALASGEHHVLLVSKPVTSFDRALVCVAEGEPAKEDVAFAGRFLHELGGVATVLSVAWNDDIDTDHLEQFVHACVQSLNLLAVPATGHVRHGIVVDEIERELKTNAYDLLVIGATLPKQKQAISLSNVVQRLLQNQINVPILIVRSSYVQPFNERLRVEQMRLKG